jgi:hypothetical protein
MRSGLYRAFRNGKHTGRISYGKDANEAGSFEVVEHEARVAREIKKRYYCSCRGRLGAYRGKRKAEPGCPAVQVLWLEGLVWDDVRSFLHDPGEVLERVKE